MILGIGNIISQAIIVTFVIVGVTLALLAIHCGAGYLLGGDTGRDTERLRDELRDLDSGISRHNIFYRFFFRNS